MKKGSKGRAWLWGLLILVLAGVLSYLVILGLKDTVVERETPEVDRGDAASIQEPVTEEKVETPTPSIKKEIYIATEKEEDDCDRIENNIAEYFLYLDQKEYIRNLDLEVNVYVRAKEILKKLAKHPPIPAGEGADHKMIIGNLYHFFRVLKGKDIRLVKEILKNEEENLEINLEMFYRWFILGDRCPDPENIRPSFDVLYQYAGFLINTTGGRAYLFRRSTSFRLLITYYCLLTIQEADKRGKNTAGIDIIPFIGPLKEEINHYPDFQFQQEFVYRLSQIEDDYLSRR